MARRRPGRPRTPAHGGAQSCSPPCPVYTPCRPVEDDHVGRGRARRRRRWPHRVGRTPRCPADGARPRSAGRAPGSGSGHGYRHEVRRAGVLRGKSGDLRLERLAVGAPRRPELHQRGPARHELGGGPRVRRRASRPRRTGERRPTGRPSSWAAARRHAGPRRRA
jgi:hypothetical protein